MEESSSVKVIVVQEICATTANSIPENITCLTSCNSDLEEPSGEVKLQPDKNCQASIDPSSDEIPGSENELGTSGDEILSLSVCNVPTGREKRTRKPKHIDEDFIYFGVKNHKALCTPKVISTTPKRKYDRYKWLKKGPQLKVKLKRLTADDLLSHCGSDYVRHLINGNNKMKALFRKKNTVTKGLNETSRKKAKVIRIMCDGKMTVVTPLSMRGSECKDLQMMRHPPLDKKKGKLDEEQTQGVNRPEHIKPPWPSKSSEMKQTQGVNRPEHIKPPWPSKSSEMKQTQGVNQPEHIKPPWPSKSSEMNTTIGGQLGKKSRKIIDKDYKAYLYSDVTPEQKYVIPRRATKTPQKIDYQYCFTDDENYDEDDFSQSTSDIDSDNDKRLGRKDNNCLEKSIKLSPSSCSVPSTVKSVGNKKPLKRRRLSLSKKKKEKLQNEGTGYVTNGGCSQSLNSAKHELDVTNISPSELADNSCETLSQGCDSEEKYVLCVNKETGGLMYVSHDLLDNLPDSVEPMHDSAQPGGEELTDEIILDLSPETSEELTSIGTESQKISASADGTEIATSPCDIGDSPLELEVTSLSTSVESAEKSAATISFPSPQCQEPGDGSNLPAILVPSETISAKSDLCLSPSSYQCHQAHIPDPPGELGLIDIPIHNSENANSLKEVPCNDLERGSDQIDPLHPLPKPANLISVSSAASTHQSRSPTSTLGPTKSHTSPIHLRTMGASLGKPKFIKMPKTSMHSSNSSMKLTIPSMKFPNSPIIIPKQSTESVSPAETRHLGDLASSTILSSVAISHNVNRPSLLSSAHKVVSVSPLKQPLKQAPAIHGLTPQHKPFTVIVIPSSKSAQHLSSDTSRFASSVTASAVSNTIKTVSSSLPNEGLTTAYKPGEVFEREQAKFDNSQCDDIYTPSEKQTLPLNRTRNSNEICSSVQSVSKPIQSSQLTKEHAREAFKLLNEVGLSNSPQ